MNRDNSLTDISLSLWFVLMNRDNSLTDISLSLSFVLMNRDNSPYIYKYTFLYLMRVSLCEELLDFLRGSESVHFFYC
jgi:hypothetical protein